MNKPYRVYRQGQWPKPKKHFYDEAEEISLAIHMTSNDLMLRTTALREATFIRDIANASEKRWLAIPEAGSSSLPRDASNGFSIPNCWGSHNGSTNNIGELRHAGVPDQNRDSGFG
jgi:hypothetical protein